MSKALDVTEIIFVVLYVSIMGLTRCYKTTVFNIYICSFLLNLFYVCILLHKPIYGFVKTNRSRTYWNTISGFNFS